MYRLLLPLFLILTACGGGHEGTVTYQVNLKPGDVTGSTIARDLRVDPDDAQWKTLLSQARSTLGEAPTRFEVTGARIQLDATKSKNVGMLQDVFSGDVVAFMRVSETGLQVEVAETRDPKGSAQVSMDPTDSSLETLDSSLARGDFRLGLRGGTTRTANGDFEATVTLTLDVTAR
ncbi:hypothetical protein JRI60_04660 [Archangium violaceum]|uniref:hypothetical protein n=1 Tax=Archangium violaceum TaxID=83451 RepID=UPI00194EC91D|nr:hypothetical protein [Archangium violaceum]QRN98358.1 hypothetical protein JRI60_04660 [Archangium violaceum]